MVLPINIKRNTMNKSLRKILLTAIFLSIASSLLKSQNYICIVQEGKTDSINAEIIDSIVITEWKSLGIGQFYDQFVLNHVQPVEILKSEEEDKYRVLNPYQDLSAEEWGEWMGGTDCPYIEFWSYDSNNSTYLKWDKFWYSTLLYNNTGIDLKAYYPSFLSSSFAYLDLKSTWFMENVAVLYPYWFVDGLGGYGAGDAVYISLPGGTDLVELFFDSSTRSAPAKQAVQVKDTLPPSHSTHTKNEIMKYNATHQ